MKYNPLFTEGAKWIGLNNYYKLLHDPVFWVSLKNTFIFVFGTVPFTTAFALLLAVLINEKIAFKGLFRTGFFVPSILSLVVISLIFKNLYSPDGYINFFLKKIGIQGPSWLTDPVFALPAIMIMDIWASIGYYMVIYLAALQAIPSDLYESAAVDGAGMTARFRYITLPYLRPVTLFIIVINTIRSFQIFIEIFTLTRGGPLHSTLTIVFNLYENAFYKFNMGYASAMAYVLCAIIMIFSVLYMKLLKIGKGVED